MTFDCQMEWCSSTMWNDVWCSNGMMFDEQMTWCSMIKRNDVRLPHGIMFHYQMKHVPWANEGRNILFHSCLPTFIYILLNRIIPLSKYSFGYPALVRLATSFCEVNRFQKINKRMEKKPLKCWDFEKDKIN